MKKLFLIVCLLITFSAFGSEAPPESFGGLTRMNGHTINSFPDFDKKWKLVTVRYRKDTTEMRMTYANDLAYKTLSEGKIDYPKGAVFAKIGFKTEEDPAFSSSEVPSGARRFQFMVRDSKKYKSTDGWGYVLFDTDGKTLPEDPHEMVLACASCHKLVENQGFIFSKLMETDPRKKILPKKSGFNLSPVFSSIDTKVLPEVIRKEIPPGFSKIQSLEGNLKEFMFQGTLDEIKPTLIKEVIKTKRPVVLFNSKSNRFSLIFINKEKCKDIKQYSMTSIISMHQPENLPLKPHMIQHFCHSEVPE